jgi:hypothetical protein
MLSSLAALHQNFLNLSNSIEYSRVHYLLVSTILGCALTSLELRQAAIMCFSKEFFLSENPRNMPTNKKREIKHSIG